MFQIAMIEDEEHTRQEVERLISWEFEKLKVQDITTEIYKTAEEFLEVKKHYDVVISDIDLPGKSGIDLGSILKAEQKDICLVFLTSYAEFAVDSYVLEAISVYFEKRYGGTFAGSITENLSGKAKREPEILLDRWGDGPEKIIS